MFTESTAYARNVGIERQPMRFGVFVWRGDGRYLNAAVYVARHQRTKYATERAAQVAADKLNADPAHYVKTDGRGFVVRELAS